MFHQVGQSPQGSGVGRCLTRLVNHPQGVVEEFPGWGWVGVSLGWSIIPQGGRNLLLDIHLEHSSCLS